MEYFEGMFERYFGEKLEVLLKVLGWHFEGKIKKPFLGAAERLAKSKAVKRLLKCLSPDIPSIARPLKPRRTS